MTQSNSTGRRPVESTEAEGRGEAELQRLEAAIESARAEEQATWDELARLSHKINNPLTSLLGRAQLLRQREDSDPYVRRAAEVIEESSKRIAEYVREMTNLVREKRGGLKRIPASSGTDRPRS